MENLKITPGPWSLDNNDVRDEAQAVQSDHNGYLIADVFQGGRMGECEANARAIAEVPAMIAFIEMIRNGGIIEAGANQIETEAANILAQIEG